MPLSAPASSGASTPGDPTPRSVAPDGFPADSRWWDAMGEALDEALACADTGDVPVGAVVLGPDGDVVGRGRNEREATGDPTAHAEVQALRAAARTLGRWRLTGCTLVVTLEPCVLCAGAALAARVDRVVLGAWDDKAGACGSVRDLLRDPRATSTVEVVGGIRADDGARVLRDFFIRRRVV